MKLEVSAEIPFPRMQVFTIYRDKLPELVKLYATEGIEVQQEILGGLLGAYTTEIGELSCYVSMWAYDDFVQREQRRAVLAADPRWQAFLPKITPLIHTQRNRILMPTPFSPAR